jgi:hypothetical protein
VDDDLQSPDRSGVRPGDEVREHQMRETGALADGGQAPGRLQRATAVVVGILASPRGAAVVAAISGFLIVVLRSPAAFFIYDAGVYWVSSVALISGGDHFTLGGLLIRGALTPMVYVPAAAATSILGPASAVIAVLVQNAVLIAILGTVLVPALARLFVPTPTAFIYLSALATAVLFGGMAPYPLVDLWAVSLVLVAILVVAKHPRSWIALAVGGVLLGAVFNLRPAYLVPVVLIVLSWGFFSRLPSLAVILGFAVALVPQVVTNAIFTGSLAPWPVNAFVVTDVQTKYAGFIVRYDTLAYVPDAAAAQLFYCNPGMANKYLSGSPGGMGELALTFVQHMPTSIKFVAQKISASLHWTSASPYSGYPSTEMSALTLGVVAVCAVGLLGLIWFLVRSKSATKPLVLRHLVPILALWLGVVATLGFSTPEARFAIPLIVVGLVGCGVIGSAFAATPVVSAKSIVWVGGALALITAILWIGHTGLAHPAELGDATARICSTR